MPISREEAIDYGYPLACLYPRPSPISDRGHVLYWDGFLVDRRRRARMRRRWAKQRRQADERFKAQVAQINAHKERMRRDVAYFLEVLGWPKPSNHPAVLALVELQVEDMRTVIKALPFQPPNPAFFEQIQWMEKERENLYGNVVRTVLMDDHG